MALITIRHSSLLWCGLNANFEYIYNAVLMLHVAQLGKFYVCICILLLWWAHSPPLNLLVCCSMNGLAFVLAQTAAAED